jgi:hypothetical protein
MTIDVSRMTPLAQLPDRVIEIVLPYRSWWTMVHTNFNPGVRVLAETLLEQ